MRRLCLFAGYDKDNIIQDYVVYLIKKLSALSDVYYLGNGNFQSDELFKIAPYTKMIYTKQHNLKDFGSWQILISKLGWENISKYDEVIMCNDSVYGPLCDLDEVFWQMERLNYDFWSITSDYYKSFHLHSYFMVFNQEIIKNPNFQNFWKNDKILQNSTECEYTLTTLLTAEGFIGNSFIKNYSQDNILYEPQKLVNEYSSPFIKTKSFLPQNSYTAQSAFGIRLKLLTQTNYDIALISKHIKNANLPQTLKQKIADYAFH